MSKKKGCKDCPDDGRNMSRGDFLKTSAVAAGGVAAAGVAATQTSAAEQESCFGQNCGGSARLEWSIPAGILNMFWTDIYPRLVAAYWSGTAPGFVLGAKETAISAAITNLTGTREFERRKSLVLEYMNWEYAIPMEVVATGGFDFVISGARQLRDEAADQAALAQDPPARDRGGLDLFLPDAPPNAAEMFRYYSFRYTGKPTLGLPNYLAEAYSAASIDGPTGPGMVTMPDPLLDVMAAQAAMCPELQCLLEQIRLLQANTREGHPLQDVHAYKCFRKKQRCWQLEGVVYRALMTELPRIVAVMWQEEAMGVVNPLYRDRFGDNGVTDDGNTDEGLRRTFNERLELSLPKEEDFYFGTDSSSARIFEPSAQQGGECEPVPPPTFTGDVNITNLGFHIPYPGAGPSLTTMINDIAAGGSGNPVFTSSERTLLW